MKATEKEVIPEDARPGRAEIATVWTLAVGLLAACGSCGGDTEEGPGGSPTGPSPPPPVNPSASYSVEYGTFVGGSGDDEAREPILLNGGRLLFGVRTQSSDLTTTSGAYQPGYGGGRSDTYLAILAPDGSGLEAATYFGGSGMERVTYGMALGSNGDIVFTSGTTSPDIPTHSGAYRPDLHQPVPDPGGGYVCRMSGDLGALRWCTYTGGGWPRGGLTLDPQENVIVVGRIRGSNFSTTSGAVQEAPRGTDDAFVLKLNSSGTAAIFSTRLGGGGTEPGEVAVSARVLSDGTVSISGNSTSADFPTTPGAAQTTGRGPRDAFLAALDPSASSLRYSTLMGGSQGELSEHRHWNLPDGSVLLAGVTSSNDLPAAVGSLSGSRDGFLARLRPDGSAFDYVRYLGGSGEELLIGPVLDGHGNIILFGRTTSRDLPTTENAIQRAFAGGSHDGVIYILDPQGSSVVMLSYLGGNGADLIRGIAVGPNDELYLVGETDSGDFPVTSGAFQPSFRGGRDGFVVKLAPTGN